MLKEKRCNKDCHECGRASFRMDNKGYPFGIECLKHGDFVNIEDAKKVPKKFFVEIEGG